MLIIDDPQPGSPAEAHAARDRVARWWAEWRRERPDTPILVVIARPHPDDTHLPEGA